MRYVKFRKPYKALVAHSCMIGSNRAFLCLGGRNEKISDIRTFLHVLGNLRLLVKFGNLWSKFEGKTQKDVKVAKNLSMLSLTTLTNFCCI